MKEIFKVIPDFPNYMVSNCGRVKTLARKIRYVHPVTKEEHFRFCEEMFLKVQYNKISGYKKHHLYINNKMYNKNVHQLVASAFLEKLPSQDTVNHIDGNKHNNRVDNLEWCTRSYNHQHAIRTGLTPKGSRIGMSKLNERSVYAIKLLLSKGVDINLLAEAFKVTSKNLVLIKKGKAWIHVNIGEN